MYVITVKQGFVKNFQCFIHADSCKHDPPVPIVLALVFPMRPFRRAIRNLALRASTPAGAGGLLIIRRSLRTIGTTLIHASMIRLVPIVLALVFPMRPFRRAIRNLALRASTPAGAGGLLMIRRSLRTIGTTLIHASMIRLVPIVLALVFPMRPFRRAIRNLALRASTPAGAGGLLIIRRSLRTIGTTLIHASMIRLVPIVLAELL